MRRIIRELRALLAVELFGLAVRLDVRTTQQCSKIIAQIGETPTESALRRYWQAQER